MAAEPKTTNLPGNDADGSSPESHFFGKYDLGKIIGCGAYGKVYHARNIHTGQSVAIKAISKQKILKGGLTAQVKREISIMRRLRNPNIVKLFEVLATKTKIYFVMEFAKGGELFSKIAKGRFSEDLSRRYFRQLISAVGYCHSRGVFHRDLKPENLLLDENWDLKVTDFGLSAVTDQVKPDGLLYTLCGTPAYVAPEILAKKGYNGAQIDVWSCGIILFVLIAGYLPFNDPNLMVMYRKIYKGEFRCPKWTSPDLKRLISRLLDTNPVTRITIDEILRDPWFTKGGYEEVKFHIDDLDLKDCGAPGDETSVMELNAFDIISFSPGFDLSSLFNEHDVVCKRSERFLSGELPDKIIATLVEVATKVNMTVIKRKDWGIKLEAGNGKCFIVVDIYRLTEAFVVVEVRESEVGVGMGHKIWNDKLRPQLSELIYRAETSLSDIES